MENQKIKRTRKHKSGINTFTKILIGVLLGLLLAYLWGKFNNAYKLVNPLRSPIEKRTKDTTPTPKTPRIEPGEQKEALQKSLIKDPAREAIYIYFGDDPTAYAVARAEAGLTCHKVGHNKNGTVDRGLFQINSVHDAKFKAFGGDPFNCWDNARVAYEIYKRQGWQPWVAYTSGGYLAFMP